MTDLARDSPPSIWVTGYTVWGGIGSSSGAGMGLIGAWNGLNWRIYTLGMWHAIAQASNEPE